METTLSIYIRTPWARSVAYNSLFKILRYYCRFRRIYYYRRIDLSERSSLEANLGNLAIQHFQGEGSDIIKKFYEHVDIHNCERLLLSRDRHNIINRFKNQCDIKDNDYDIAADRSKGAIMFAPHFGAYSFVFTRCGIPIDDIVNIIIRPHPPFNKVDLKTIKQLELIPNTKVILAEHDSIKRSIAALSRGEIVIIFSDRADFDNPNRNLSVNLFGEKVLTQKGLSYLVSSSSAPVYLYFFERKIGENSIKYSMKCKLLFKESDIRKKEPVDIMQYFYSILGNIIIEKPYLWERWKHFERMKVKNYPKLKNMLNDDMKNITNG